MHKISYYFEKMQIPWKRQCTKVIHIIGGEKEGDEVIFKRSKLSGVRYKVISTDRKNGKLRVIVTAPIDYESCYLNISMLDDSNNSIAVGIKTMKCNGINIKCSDSSEYGPFSVKMNQKIRREPLKSRSKIMKQL